MTGADDDFIYGLRPLDLIEGLSLRQELAEPLQRLSIRAGEQGIRLAIASGYRDFARQLSIWNRKVTGELPVRDSEGNIISIGSLTERELVFAILRWSALPGTSRHHWGTDFDIYDQAVALPPGYRVQLTVAEAYQEFAVLHQWLDRELQKGDLEGFYRPYQVDHGGIAPEPWHLSYRPIASACEQLFSIVRLREVLETSPLALKDVVLDNLDEIVQRFVGQPAVEIVKTVQ